MAANLFHSAMHNFWLLLFIIKLYSQVNISFELICGFLGNWGNSKIKKKKIIVKKTFRISETFCRLVLEMFWKFWKFLSYKKLFRIFGLTQVHHFHYWWLKRCYLAIRDESPGCNTVLHRVIFCLVVFPDDFVLDFSNIPVRFSYFFLANGPAIWYCWTSFSFCK